jgi:hypothetical protein
MTQTYFSPFFPNNTDEGKKGTTIPVVTTTIIEEITSDVGTAVITSEAAAADAAAAVIAAESAAIDTAAALSAAAAAATDAEEALNAASGALASAIAAAAALEDAELAKIAAQAASTNAAADEALAEAHKNAAATSASNAAGSATTATGQAVIATDAASAAATSQSVSAGHATTATTQAGIATSQAAAASASASTATTQASLSATHAATSATQAGISTTQAGIATAAGATATSQATLSSTFATNAANSASTASGHANTAATQAGIATTQATNASASASSAATSSTLSAAYRDEAKGYSNTKANLIPNGDMEAGPALWTAYNMSYDVSSFWGGRWQNSGTLSSLSGVKISIDPTRRYKASVTWLQHIGNTQNYAGLTCFNIAGDNLGNIYFDSVVGQTFNAGDGYTREQIYQGINTGLANPIYTTGGQFPPNTVAVAPIILSNFNSILPCLVDWVSFELFDITESHAATTQAGISTAQAAVATSAASTATTQATLSATYANRANAYSQTLALTPNAHFTENGLLWNDNYSLFDGGTTPSSGWQASFNGRTGVFTGPVGSSLQIAGKCFAIDPNRRYRVKTSVWTAGTNYAYTGLSFFDANKAWLGQRYGNSYILGVNGTWVDLTATFDGIGTGDTQIPSNAAYAMPFSWANTGGGSGTQGAIDYCYAEDVTESITAASSATIASTQAATATSAASTATTQASLSATYAGNAANSATTAGGHATTASTQAGIATTQAAIATAQASAAQISAVLSASIGMGSLNKNPTFADWAGGSGTYPANWADWAAGYDNVKVSGDIGGFAFRQIVVAGTSRGILQSITSMNGKKGNGYYVLEAEVTLESGSLESSAIFLGNSAGEFGSIKFSIEKEATTNSIVGAGSTGRKYKFTKLIQITSIVGVENNWLLYALSNWAGYGSNPAKTITWHLCSVRDATPAEIRDQIVLAPMEATVATHTSAIVTLSASAATQSTKLTAITNTVGRTGGLSMHPNPSFSDLSDAVPSYAATVWQDWFQTPTYQARSQGVVSPYAYRLLANANWTSGIATNSNYPMRPGWYVLECTFELIDGNLQGGGVYLSGKNSSGSEVETPSFALNSLKDTNGLTAYQGASPFRLMRTTQLFQMSNTNLTQYGVVLMLNWGGFGAQMYKYVDLHHLAVRPATASEIRDQTVLAPMEATVSTHASTLATHTSSIATLNSTVFTQGANISSQATAITTLQGTVGGHTTSIATLNSTVSTQGASISSQATAITTLEGTVGGHTSSIATLNSTVTTQGASIVTQATAITALNARTATYLNRVSAGSGVAEVELVALDSGGITTSAINLRASKISLGNLTDPALEIVGGVSTFKGELNVGGTSGARVTITKDLIRVYDASNVLRVRLGIW